MHAETMTRVMKNTKTIAVVGMSDKPYRPGFYVPSYMQDVGYKIIPVNPYLNGEVLGERAYDRLSDVPEPVDLVLLFQRSENVPPFVREAIEIGAKAIWMQQGIQNQASAAEAVKAGLDVVQNACMMVEHRRHMS